MPKKTTKEINRDHDKKRKNQPSFSTVRNVPEESINKLEALAERFGNKKIAILKAIDELHEKNI